MVSVVKLKGLTARPSSSLNGLHDCLLDHNYLGRGILIDMLKGHVETVLKLSTSTSTGQSMAPKAKNLVVAGGLHHEGSGQLGEKLQLRLLLRLSGHQNLVVAGGL